MFGINLLIITTHNHENIKIYLERAKRGNSHPLRGGKKLGKVTRLGSR